MLFFSKITIPHIFMEYDEKKIRHTRRHKLQSNGYGTIDMQQYPAVEFFYTLRRKGMLKLLGNPVPQWMIFSKHHGKNGYGTINMYPCPAVDGFFFKQDEKEEYGKIDTYSCPAVDRFFKTRWEEGVR